VAAREERIFFVIVCGLTARSFVFTSEHGAPFTTAGFAKMVERAGKAAKLAFKAHPQRPTPICCATPAGLRWPIKAMIPAPCKLTSATKISSTQRSTGHYRKIGLRIFGDNKATTIC
jgi:hypothetical protein